MLERLKRLQADDDTEDHELHSFEWHYLKRLSRLDLSTLWGHTLPVQSVAYSRDGTRLASACTSPAA